MGIGAGGEVLAKAVRHTHKIRVKGKVVRIVRFMREKEK